jgi:hypothetical protein
MSKGVIDTIIGGLVLAAGVVLEVVTFGAATPLVIAIASFLISAGAGLLLVGVGTLISGQSGGGGGIATAARNPVKPWDVVYGRARIGGTVVFLGEWGDTNKYLDMVIVLAAHRCKSVDYLLFNSQRVNIGDDGQSFSPTQVTVNITSIARAGNVVTVDTDADISLFDGDDVIIDGTPFSDFIGRFPVTVINSRRFTYLSGGPAESGSGGTVTTTYADYGNTVYMEAMLGQQFLGQTFFGMLTGTPEAGQNPNNPWTANCSLLGKTAVFLRLKYDAKMYASGIPSIAFIMHGKDDVLDVRTNLTGYTENAALIIADYLADKTWGFKAVYGTEIPTAPLIAAANICDEAVPLATGGTEPRYALNGTFNLNVRRGEVLQNLLTACAGRLSYVGGLFTIHPGAWAGVSATVSSSWLLSKSAGGFRWRPTVSLRDLCNGVKGTYVSPANNWGASDFPAYAQDGTHGYNSGPPELNYDANLEADGGDRRWRDIQLPFTISPATAQRIAKIELMRIRHQGTGTFTMNMAAYQFVPLDVLAASLDIFGWDGEYLEVLAVRFKIENQQSGDGTVVLLGSEIDVQQTDPSIYAWDIGEELSPQGYVQAIVPDNRKPKPPTDFKATPDQGIVVLTWKVPDDAYVLNGGHFELRYQKLESPPGIWISLGHATPTTTRFDVLNLESDQDFVFEIRSVNAAGVPSDWVMATATAPQPSAAVWMPNTLSAPDGDPIRPAGDITFAMHQVGPTSKPYITVTGELPVNNPANLLAPVINGSALGTNGMLKAGRTYFLSLAVVANNQPSVRSTIVEMTIPDGPNNGAITLQSIAWPPGDWDTWMLYASVDRKEMMCVQQSGDGASLPDDVTLTALPNWRTQGPASTLTDHLRVTVHQLCHIGVVANIITEVGGAQGTGDNAAGWIRCMHLAADGTQDTDPYEGGINWFPAGRPVHEVLLATDDWTGRIVSVLTHKVDGSAPIANFRCVAYDPQNGKLSVTPDPVALGIGPGDIFAIRFKPQWNETLDGFVDEKMVNGEFPLGTARDRESFAIVLDGPGKGQLVPVTSHDNTSYQFGEALIEVTEDSIVSIVFSPVLQTADGPTISVSDYGTQGSEAANILGLLEHGVLIQGLLINKDGGASPDNLSPAREFFVFKDVSYGQSGDLQEIARLEFGRGSDGGDAAVGVGDLSALIDIDEDVVLQGWRILNKGLPVGDSTFDIMRKPAGSSPDTAYTSLLGSNLIVVPDGVHDTVIFSSAFAAGIELTLKKGDIIYAVCLSVGATAPISPVIRVFAGLPLATSIDGTTGPIGALPL